MIKVEHIEVWGFEHGAKALGKKFGVDRITIIDVASGKTWRHVS